MTQSQKILMIFVATNLLNYLDRYVLASVLNPIGKEFALDDAALGHLAMVFLIVYLAAAPIFGYLAERHSRTKLVSVGVLIWSIATAGAAFAPNYKILLLTRALVGVGEAAYATLGPAILSDMYPEEQRAKIFTWFYLAIPVGSALGFALGGAVEGLAGWRASFFIAGIPGLFMAAKLWALVDPRDLQAKVTNKKEISKFSDFFHKITDVLRNRIWIACTISYIGYTFAMGALSHWAPTLFQRQFGQSAGTAGLIFGAIAVVTGILGTFTGGKLTDKFQYRWPNIGLWVSIVSLGCAVPITYFALIQTAVVPAYLCWSAAMYLLFINTSPVNTLTVSCLPNPMRAIGIAMNIFFIHLLGDAISPTIVGMKSDTLGASGQSLSVSMLVTIPAIIISCLALFGALSKAKIRNEAL